MELPEHERFYTGEDGLTIREIARRDMRMSSAEYSEKIWLTDNFFPGSYGLRKFQKQVRRDLLYLELIKDVYPLDYIPL